MVASIGAIRVGNKIKRGVGEKKWSKMVKNVGKKEEN
jgi:hypothetical protein